MPADTLDRTERSLPLRILVTAARGSGIGVVMMIIGYVTHPRNDVSFGQSVGAGALLGAVIALVLMATKSWRTDIIGHYASCIVAGVVAGLAGGVWLALSDPTSAGLALGFGAFLGLCGGLALGAGLRRWNVRA